MKINKLCGCAGRAALLCCVGVQPLLAQEASIVWERALDAPSSEIFDIDRVDPLPQGGFRLTGGVTAPSNDGGYYAAVQDFDSDALPVGPLRLGPMPRLRSGRSAEPDVVVPFEPRAFSLGRVSREPGPCWRRDLGNGIESRVVERPYHQLSYQTGNLDGEGGAFATSWGNDDAGNLLSRVYRHQVDCSIEVIGDFAFHVGTLVNSSRAPVVFTGRSADGTDPIVLDRLAAFDRDGLRWSLPLQPGGESSTFVIVLAEMDGDAIVGGAGPTQSALYRVDPLGAVRWSLPLGTASIPAAASLDALGLLVSGAQRGGTDPSPVSFWRVDPASGRLVWQYRAEGMPRGRLVPHADPETPKRLAVLGYGGETLIELDGRGGARSLRSLPVSVVPVLQLADGRLIATQGNSFGVSNGLQEPGRRLVMVDPFDAAAVVEESPPLRLSWPQRPLNLHADAAGVVVVSAQDEDYLVEAFDHAGAPRWQHLLAAPVLEGAADTPPTAQLLTAGDQLCVLLHRSGGRPAAKNRLLSCLAAADGTPVFTHVELLERPTTLTSKVRLIEASAGTVSVLLSSLYQCPPAATCPGSIDRLDIAAGGEVTRQRLRVDDETHTHVLLEPLDARHFLIASRSREDGPWRLLSLGLDGETVELDGAPEWTPYGYASHPVPGGGALLLLAHTEDPRTQLLRFRADGRLAFSEELDGRLFVNAAFPDSTPPPPQYALLAPAGGGAIVVTVVDDDQWLTLLDAEGQQRWRRQIGSAWQDSMLGLQSSADGSVLLATERDARVLLRRFTEDGRVASSGSTMLNGPSTAGARWTASGEAMVIAGGARLHGDVPQAAVLKRLRVPPAIGCSDPLPAGFWHDPGSSGQGVFLHPAADGNQLTATWLSFTMDGDTDRSDLRWFSLFGDANDEGPIDLQIQSSQGGGFATSAADSSETVGEVQLERVRCDLLALDYRIDDGEFSGEKGRLHLIPAAPQDGGSLGGIWFAPETEGQGLLLHGIGGATGTPERLVGAWATFDPDSAADDPTAQHWFTLDTQTSADGSFRGDIIRTIGGSFAGRSTANHLKVGEATLRFDACDLLQIDYQFADDGTAAEFAGMSGSLALQRLDGCGSD